MANRCSLSKLTIAVVVIVHSSSAENLCNKLQYSPKHFHLQALTFNRSHSQLWLIESRHLYIVPQQNLDTTTDHLRLYNLTDGRLIDNMGIWAEIGWLQVLEGPRQSDLHWLAILNDSYRFIKFEDTYYVIQADRGYFCDSYDDKVMPWRLTTMRRPNGVGELWIGLTQSGKVRRVMFTALEMKVVRKRRNGCNIVELNFPGEETGLFQPIRPRHLYVFLETNANRTTATFVPSTKSAFKGYDHDLFAFPPAVISTEAKLYLFSFHLKRVYIINTTDLMATLEYGQVRSFRVASKSWASFFVCEPNSSAVDPGIEPTQEEYVKSLGDLYPENKFSFGDWLDEYSTEISIVLIGALLITVIILFGYIKGVFRKKKKKREQEKPANTNKTPNGSAKLPQSSQPKSPATSRTMTATTTSPSNVKSSKSPLISIAPKLNKSARLLGDQRLKSTMDDDAKKSTVPSSTTR